MDKVKVKFKGLGAIAPDPHFWACGTPILPTLISEYKYK